MSERSKKPMSRLTGAPRGTRGRGVALIRGPGRRLTREDAGRMADAVLEHLFGYKADEKPPPARARNKPSAKRPSARSASARKRAT